MACAGYAIIDALELVCPPVVLANFADSLQASKDPINVPAARHAKQLLNILIGETNAYPIQA